jgi:acyl-CoA thioester hydrolase
VQGAALKVMVEAPAHRFPVRVYYEDTDAGGIVYHSAYLRFAERGRTEWLRDLGFDHTGLRAETGAGFAVARAEIDYLKPARLDDLLEVETRIVKAGGASTRIEQDVLRNGEAIVRMALRLAFMGADGKPHRMPEELRDLLVAGES